jgi:hypothetical protein
MTIKKTKAQMEILGLSIVVLLLILGMVFVIKFIGISDKGSIRREVTESQTASNYIASYLDTTVKECRDLTIKELLIDCAEGGAALPNGGTIVCPTTPSIKSCQMANDVAKTIFSMTFDQWKTRYYFSSFVQNRNPFIELSFPADDPATGSVETVTKCKGTYRSKDYPLSTNSGTLHIRLDLCGLK